MRRLMLILATAVLVMRPLPAKGCDQSMHTSSPYYRTPYPAQYTSYFQRRPTTVTTWPAVYSPQDPSPVDDDVRAALREAVETAQHRLEQASRTLEAYDRYSVARNQADAATASAQRAKDAYMQELRSLVDAMNADSEAIRKLTETLGRTNEAAPEAPPIP